MKTFPVIILLILIFCSSIRGQIPDSLEFISLPPKEFQLRLLREQKAVLIDVREFFEYRTSRLKGAVNIPSSGNLESSADTMQKDLSLFFYCTSGYRSKRVAKDFYDEGFRSLYSLDGGIVAWRKQHLPVDKKHLRRHD